MSSTNQTTSRNRSQRLDVLRKPGVRIAPSVLSADFARLGEQIRQVEKAGAQILHLDIMDGHFVPNLSIGVPVVQSVRKCTDLFLDVHLMITDPLFYAEPFARAGADLVTFHIEVAPEPMRIIQRLRELGVGVGVSLNPGTSADTLAAILGEVDMVLVMTVWPGFGGQKFIEPMLEKIRTIAHLLRPDQRLEVDGGIQAETIARAALAGADTFVAGSAVFDAADPAAEVFRLEGLARSSRKEGKA
jgi:ribulose-phosphate 3-epimerase